MTLTLEQIEMLNYFYYYVSPLLLFVAMLVIIYFQFQTKHHRNLVDVYYRAAMRSVKEDIDNSKSEIKNIRVKYLQELETYLEESKEFVDENFNTINKNIETVKLSSDVLLMKLHQHETMSKTILRLEDEIEKLRNANNRTSEILERKNRALRRQR